MRPYNLSKRGSMPALAPLKLTLYEPDTVEVHGEYLCNFTPLRILRLAVRLSRSKINVNPDTLAGLIVDLFGNQFSVDELVKYSEPNDRMMVLQAVLNRAGSYMTDGSEAEAGDVAQDQPASEEDENWLDDLVISLIKNFEWSLYEIDNTAIESLFPLILRYAEVGRDESPFSKNYTYTKVFADQVQW